MLETEAKNVRDVTMTSSPFLIPKAANAKSKVPLLNATAYEQ
jgi:hypothetical protein